MAWAQPAMQGAFSGSFKPKTSLLDRALNDLGNMATGFMPGIAELGAGVVNDAYAAAPFTPNKFKLPGLGKTMARGMWEESALPPLLLGDFGEAFSRANARPVSALLDASLLAPVTTGAARLGTLSKATRPASMDILGYKRTADEFAQSIKDPESSLDFMTPSELPAALDLHDGSHVPMREFLPGFGGAQPIRRGDELWLRQNRRTMAPATPPETMLQKQGLPDGDQTVELYDLFKTSQDPRVSGIEKLGDDPWLDYTNYRALSEPIAKIGDFTETLRDKIPDTSRFSTSQRIGRKMMHLNDRQKHHDIDDERAAYEKALAPALAALRARDEYASFSDDELKARLGNETFRRAVQGDKASLEEAIREFDPNTSLEKVTLEQLSGLTAQEARHNLGIHFARVNDHDTYELPGDHDNLGEWIERNREMIGTPDRYELRVMSPRHREALNKRDSDYTAAEIEIQRVLNSSPFVKPILVNLKTGEREVFTPQDFYERKEIRDRVLGDEEGWDVEFANDGTGFVNTVREKGDGDSVVEQSRLDNQRFREAVSAYKASRARTRSYDEHSRFIANAAQMLRDPKSQLVPVEGQSGPGVMQALDRIRKESLEGVEAPELDAYFEHLAALRERSAQNVESWMGTDLFDEAAKTRNKNRGAEWTHDIEGLSGEFFPMQKEVHTPREKFIDDRTRDDIQRDPLEKGAGDPFDLFLEGKFRTDHKVILDDFETNRSYKASKDLLKNARTLAMKLTPEQFERFKGRAITEADALGDNYSRGTFVSLDPQGPLAQITRTNIEGLERMAAMYAESLPEAASAARKLASDIKHTSVTNPLDAPLSVGAKDPAVRAAVKEGLAEPEMIHVLPTQVYRALHKEYMAGQQSLRGAFRLITDMWKYTVLHMRFAQWMKNNVIGAHLMVIMSGGPSAYLKAQARRGGDFDEMKDQIQEGFSDVMASGSSMQARETNLAPEGTARGTFERKFVNPLSEFNAKWADDPTRTIRIMELMDEQLSVVAKAAGKSPADLTPEQVGKFINDPVMRKELARRTNTDMVDFGDMSEFEKRWMRSLFPFWSWMKGSTKASQRLAADHPGRVWAAGEVADLGEMISAEDQGSVIPDFSKGWWDPGEKGGMVVDMAGMNPYQSSVDWALLGMGLMPDLIPGDMSSAASYRQFGSENMLGTMHPFISGGVEAMTGKNLFFGTPTQNQSFGSGFLQGQVDLPILKLGQKLWTNETGPDATTQTSRFGTAINYAGIPFKDPRWGQVHARGWDEMNERYRNGLASRELAPAFIPGRDS